MNRPDIHHYDITVHTTLSDVDFSADMKRGLEREGWKIDSIKLDRIEKPPLRFAIELTNADPDLSDSEIQRILGDRISDARYNTKFKVLHTLE